MTDKNPASELRPVTPLGIAAREVAELRDAVANSKMPEDAILASLDRIAALVGGLDGYLETTTTPQSSALEALAQRTAGEPWARRFREGASDVPLEAEMLSGHVEGQFLKMLVAATRARRVLEIGLFTGYSALAMAEALPENGRLIALELDPFVADFARSSFVGTAGARIDVRVGPAADSLAALADEEPFDFVFIDADKVGYLAYLEALLDNGMLSDNALIAIDNTLYQGEVYAAAACSANGDAIAAFNAAVADDPRVEQVLLPLRDGVTLIRRL